MNIPDLGQQSKLPNVKTTIFAVMSQMAAQHGALNLSQGFPDFSCPSRLMDLVDQAMRKGLNQYAPMTGIPLLRQRIVEKMRVMYNADVDVDGEITVTSGATEALFVAIQSCVRPGDEVIVFDPCYDSYEPAVNLAGGVCRHIKLRAPDYAIDWQRVKDTMNEKTRLMIINSPHNPSGAVLDQDDLRQLAELIADSSVLLMSDEVYEHIIFDGRHHESMLLYPQLRERSFIISSFGKTYHTTGWKVGYCIAPPVMSAEFRKVHQYVTFSISTPMQYAIAEFMADPSHHLALPEFYQHKRDLFRQGVAGSRWELLPCGGTYFQLMRYDGISDRSDMEMARWLTEEIGVASIPVSVFYDDKTDDHVLRFCFAKDDQTIQKATEILRQV